MEVSDLSKLARLPTRRLRKAAINVWIERTQFRCPHCGGKEVSTYFERSRTVRGVANANIPVATARATEVPELMSMADTVERHLDGILGYWKYGRASNAKTEGFNNKIRWLIRQAYGFRDREYFKLKIYAFPDAEITNPL